MTGLNVQEMRHQIKRINRIDLSKTNYATIRSIVSEMLSGVPIQVSASLPQDLLFRARKNPGEKLTKFTDLCAPPAELVTSFQRCNAPGKPMFYCSSRRIGALLEIDAQPGDIVYLSQWMANTRLPVNMLLDDRPQAEKLLQHMTARDEMFYGFADTRFTARVDRDFSTDYMISAAIADICTSRFGPAEDLYVDADGLVGLKYPSVVDLEGSYNIAFPPEFTDGRIGVLHLMELEVVERDGVHVAVKLLDTATDVDDGVIKWTGNSVSLPAPRSEKGAVMFRFEDGKWRVLTTEHLPIDHALSGPLLAELLKE